MFLSTFRADAGSAGGEDRSPWGQFWFQPVGMRTAGGQRVTTVTALGHPTLLSCVKVLCESMAVLEFMLNQPQEGKKGRGPQVRKHWLYRLLAKAPNRFQTPYEWRLMLMGHLVLRGNAFCQITANDRGEIIDLLPLHPDRMAIEPLDNGSYRYVYTDQTGKPIPYSRHEIWHLRSLSDDGYMGMSMLALAREAIGEGLAIQSYSSRFFGNDAKPTGGWIEYPGSFATNEAKKKFREGWQDLQGGANRGKVAVLERGMKFHEVGINNRDAQFIEARAEKRKDICAIFRVPPHKVMDLDRSTNNNIEHQDIEFWKDAMLPWIRLWQSSISFFLLGEESDLVPSFDYTVMMLGDGKSRAERLARLTLAGILMRNEAREEEGYDPIDGLDEPLQPVNMETLEQAEQRQQQQQVPQNGPDGTQPAAQDPMPARMTALLQANADRLARRFAKGLNADVVAEAMAVPLTIAQAWCSVNREGAQEEDISASLMEMAGGFEGNLPQPAQRVTVNVAQPVNNINVQQPNIEVAAPVTHVHVDPPNLEVNLPAGETNISMPVSLDAHIHDNRTVTKTVVAQRGADGTLVATVKEETHGTS